MLKNIRDYEKYLTRLLETSEPNMDWRQILAIHDRKISYFQTERLIHLIVTMFVSLFTIISFFTSFFIQRTEILVLSLILIILSFAYLYHYYQLENLIQGLYQYSIQIEQKISS